MCFAVVQSLSCAQLFVTPWTAAHQASLSFTTSWSLLKLMSIESMMPSNHLILCHPLLLLSSIFQSISLFQWVGSLHRVAKVLELKLKHQFSSVHFSSVAQLCMTLCHPMDCSMPGFPVHHQLWDFTQTHVCRVGDALQPSHPLSSPSPAFNLSQHQGLLQWVSPSHQVAKVLELQL